MSSIRSRLVSRTTRAALVAAAVMSGAPWGAPAAQAAGKHTDRLSVSSSGRQASCQGVLACGSGAVYTSGKGRYAVFESSAHGLTRTPTNGTSQIYLRDRTSHKTYMVSVNSHGNPGNGPSHSARGVSPDGRYIVFESLSTNLVKGDFNGSYDVFMRDRKRKRTYLISQNSAGVEGNGGSSDPVVSADGRFVAFESLTTNLDGVDRNGALADVYVRDRKALRTYRISVSSAGRQGSLSSSDPNISPNGRYVVFESRAHLVRNDNNKETDIFLRDRGSHKTYDMSVNSRGVEGNAGSHSSRVSPSGRYVAFESFSSNLGGGPDKNHAADVFIRDRGTHKTFLISVNNRGRRGNKFSSDPAISGNGRFIAFESAATNLAPGGDRNAHVDVFLRDRRSHKTYCVSVTKRGHPGNAAAENPWMSLNGRWVFFSSNSSNLVPGDTNHVKDVFVRGPYA